jgi:rhodanese-related sulfurtransferase
MNQITATELKTRIDSGEDIQLIDVRQPHEADLAKIPGATLIPMTELMSRLSELDPSREAIIHCHMGGRSARVIDALERSGYEGKLTNLAGGITAWSHEVDPSVPTY